MLDTSTICAISTPAGKGAIAVVRLSGPDAIHICDKLFFFKDSRKKLASQKPNTLHFGSIKEKGEVVDEVVVGLFKSPHSYTGEDVVEISCHGATYIQQKILQLLIDHGARLAGPGEFTIRAFLNGKMDLSQAEAVADLIAASSEASHRVAIQQMRGGFSDKLRKLRERLLHFISMIELELDFSEEEVEFADRKELTELIRSIHEIIQGLVESFSLGNVIKEGVPVTIVGQPNVGKSTLLNALLQEERAIVSEFEGTTRDAIEDTFVIKGINFRFIDTAGLRQTTDVVETMGVERTIRKIGQATVILLVVDAREHLERINIAIRELKEQVGESDKHIILVVNKADTLELEERNSKFTSDNLPKLPSDQNFVVLSALHKENLDRLHEKLLEVLEVGVSGEHDVIITNARHYEALQNSLESISRVMEGLEQQISGDLLAQDIREALHYLGEITGEITTDEILGNIFSRFCIGK